MRLHSMRTARISRLFSLAIAFVLSALMLLPQGALASSSSSLKTSDIVEGQTDFVGMDLKTKEFVSLKLDGADFSGADLRGAVFNGSSLRDASFRGVDFTDGISYGSSFRNADLTDAVFNSALLLNSYFYDADVTNADFTFAVVDGVQLSVMCKTASGVNPTTGVDTRDSLGCSEMSDEEFAEQES